MRYLRFLIIMLVTTFVCASAGADDGAITNKSMSKNIHVPTYDQEVLDGIIEGVDADGNIVYEQSPKVPEAEHAFADFMKFYVPAQAASGELLTATAAGGIAYCDIDNQPESGEDCINPVETLGVAKPLINVFIYGPQFEVDHTAFAHRWFDTYAAVSLDDGETFKKTNLSESADLSSFNLEEDPKDSNKDPLPNDHTVLFGSENNGAWHKPGYDTPYVAHCSECHGSALQGTAQAPSCYSCHGSNKWEEPTPIELGPIVTSAIFKNGKLSAVGENALSKIEVTLVNGATGHEIDTTDATNTGTFEFNVKAEEPPCTVSALYDNAPLADVQGPALAVVDKDGIPIEECEGHPVDLTDYPGGSYNVFRAVAGNKVLVAWPSRYCGQGQPAYSLTTDNDKDDSEEDDESGLSAAEKLVKLTAITDFIRLGNEDLGVLPLPDFTSTIDGDLLVDDLYLVDAFGVAGSQGSVDFADEGYPQAGVVPFGCVWTARGVMLPGDDPRTEDFIEASHMVWTKAERLTSGRRDPNRIEVHAVQGAGFVITWQEDPEGLRPGQGLGPGEGWSGAVAHSQTDAWYSFINEEYFDIVEDPLMTDVLTPINILDAELDKDLGGTGRPKVFVPMAVPMRLSNNAKCNPLDKETSGEGNPPLYCVYLADLDEDVPVGAVNFGLKDQCADTVEIWTGNEAQDKLVLSEICVADTDGDLTADLPNRANTSVTRPRTSLQVYKPSSAWVVVVAEESKGLGKYFFRADANGDDDLALAEQCTEEESVEDPTCTEEIGKNIWYFSFDMGTPDTSAGKDNPNSLVSNLVNQGNMLNQAEVYWATGELLGLMDTATMGEDGGGIYDPYDFAIVNTEIARRGSLLVQGIGKAIASKEAGGPGLVAMPSWKQGVMRQGGPADTMLRRIVLPDDFDPAVDNPYAFENMVCESFLIEPGANPYYPGGLCADPAINLSGVVPDTCLDDELGGTMDCPKVDFDGSTYGISDTVPILQGYEKGEGNKTRVLTWHQCPSDYTVVATDLIGAVDCETDDRTDDFVNLRDQSWYNPLDVSKGHRGFLDGDFVMFLYGWSPNWRLNAKGHDRYELYVRRSFDGGLTWGTTPGSFLASNDETYSGTGTVTCESYRKALTGEGDPLEPKACYEFAAGAAEHARNVTQHKSMKITTLDPRYASAGSPRGVGIDPVTCTDGLFPTDADGVSVIDDIFTCDDTSDVQDTDLRNPSRYFMVFETGDNRTVEVGEAEPLDLFYSRAESFGDDYVVWTETDTESANLDECYPTDPHTDDPDTSDIRIGSGFCNEFDRLNTGSDSHSSEASLAGNSDGSKMYAVSAQWVFEHDDDYESEIIEADAMARRVWWIDDYICDTVADPTCAYSLPGTN